MKLFVTLAVLAPLAAYFSADYGMVVSVAACLRLLAFCREHLTTSNI